MIAHEVPRLYPPVTMINCRTCKTARISNIAYPPGVGVLVLPVLFIHHDSEIWGPDAT
jgi:cytochrome P450